MTEAIFIAESYQFEKKWDDDALIVVLTDFIDEQGLTEALEKYLETRKDDKSLTS
jgi:hypothetical protein